MKKNENTYERGEYENSYLYKMSHRSRMVIHPILLCIIMLKNIISGFKVDVLFKRKIPKTNQSIIFCITHIGKHDIEICSQIIKKHYYLLSGDFENLHGTLEGTVVELNGVIYLNKYDKADRARSKEKSIEILKKGGNVMWFPEGIWNLSPNRPILPLPFGIIEVALKANAVIVPLAIEQYGKSFYVNIGEKFDVAWYASRYTNVVEMKSMAIMDLRDIMATLKWEIWEHVQQWKREELPSDYFEEFINERLKEWHGFTYEDVLAREFHPKSIIAPKEVFAGLGVIEPNKTNAFLFDKNIGGRNLV